MILYIWLIALVVAFVLYNVQLASKFKKCGVNTLPSLKQLRNTLGLFSRFKHVIDIVNDLYVAYPKDKFVGSIEFSAIAVIYIRDVELIKKVTVKDFEHFLDHRALVTEEIDPLFGRNLFSLRGQEWKDMRSTLSPAFTSSKMKQMLPFMVEVGNQMTNSLKKRLQESPIKSIDIDVKDLATRYTNDVIATCAFGLKVDSLSDPDNEFYKMGYKTSIFGFSVLIKFIAFGIMPNFMKKLNVALFSEESKSFFTQLVLDTMKDREVKKIVRPDMIHLLMEAKKGQLLHEQNSGVDVGAGFATVEESSVGKKNVERDWSDTDLVSQAVLFFIAGFETISTAMSFVIYELAINPDVQEKLYKEIKEHEERNKGKFDYNTIQSMPYMDMVVSETLRLWSPAISTDRLCVKDYNLGRPNDQSKEDYIITAGQSLTIPIMSIHRDPQYYPNPTKFDPERFSEANKHNIKPFTYMPFGAGPRNCIGSRFALCEVKVMVYQLLQCVEVMPYEKTTIPAKLSNESFNLRLKGGHWLRMKARQ